MKSRIHKGLVVRSELKPAVSLKDKAFVFTRGSNLAEKFRLIREAQAAEQVANVTPIKRRAAK